MLATGVSDLDPGPQCTKTPSAVKGGQVKRLNRSQHFLFFLVVGCKQATRLSQDPALRGGFSQGLTAEDTRPLQLLPRFSCSPG